MERGYHVIGEGITIGQLERLSGDRSCRWDPGTGTEEQAGVFASMLPEAAAPATLPRVVLFEVRDGHKPYCLAAVLADGVLGLRQLTAALSEFFPDG